MTMTKLLPVIVILLYVIVALLRPVLTYQTAYAWWKKVCKFFSQNVAVYGCVQKVCVLDFEVCNDGVTRE